jgi:hypothetical protein
MQKQKMKSEKTKRGRTEENLGAERGLKSSPVPLLDI